MLTTIKESNLKYEESLEETNEIMASRLNMDSEGANEIKQSCHEIDTNLFPTEALDSQALKETSVGGWEENENSTSASLSRSYSSDLQNSYLQPLSEATNLGLSERETIPSSMGITSLHKRENNCLPGATNRTSEIDIADSTSLSKQNLHVSPNISHCLLNKRNDYAENNANFCQLLNYSENENIISATSNTAKYEGEIRETNDDLTVRNIDLPTSSNKIEKRECNSFEAATRVQVQSTTSESAFFDECTDFDYAVYPISQSKLYDVSEIEEMSYLEQPDRVLESDQFQTFSQPSTDHYPSGSISRPNPESMESKMQSEAVVPPSIPPLRRSSLVGKSKSSSDLIKQNSFTYERTNAVCSFSSPGSMDDCDVHIDLGDVSAVFAEIDQLSKLQDELCLSQKQEIELLELDSMMSSFKSENLCESSNRQMLEFHEEDDDELEPNYINVSGLPSDLNIEMERNLRETSLCDDTDDETENATKDESDTSTLNITSEIKTKIIGEALVSGEARIDEAEINVRNDFQFNDTPPPTASGSLAAGCDFSPKQELLVDLNEDSGVSQPSSLKAEESIHRNLSSTEPLMAVENAKNIQLPESIESKSTPTKFATLERPKMREHSPSLVDNIHKRLSGSFSSAFNTLKSSFSDKSRTESGSSLQNTPNHSLPRDEKSSDISELKSEQKSVQSVDDNVHMHLILTGPSRDESKFACSGESSSNVNKADLNPNIEAQEVELNSSFEDIDTINTIDKGSPFDEITDTDIRLLSGTVISDFDGPIYNTIIVDDAEANANTPISSKLSELDGLHGPLFELPTPVNDTEKDAAYECPEVSLTSCNFDAVEGISEEPSLPNLDATSLIEFGTHSPKETSILDDENWVVEKENLIEFEEESLETQFILGDGKLENQEASLDPFEDDLETDIFQVSYCVDAAGFESAECANDKSATVGDKLIGDIDQEPGQSGVLHGVEDPQNQLNEILKPYNDSSEKLLELQATAANLEYRNSYDEEDIYVNSNIVENQLNVDVQKAEIAKADIFDIQTSEYISNVNFTSDEMKFDADENCNERVFKIEEMFEHDDYGNHPSENVPDYENTNYMAQNFSTTQENVCRGEVSLEEKQEEKELVSPLSNKNVLSFPIGFQNELRVGSFTSIETDSNFSVSFDESLFHSALLNNNSDSPATPASLNNSAFRPIISPVCTSYPETPLLASILETSAAPGKDGVTSPISAGLVSTISGQPIISQLLQNTSGKPKNVCLLESLARIKN